ncbi:MAG: SpoIID/LytB domain-containing protein [Muribaculaceae bacterium]|nr:SpoIID/LytB domain-containing protein [Muribaculaceae bacterium]
MNKKLCAIMCLNLLFMLPVKASFSGSIPQTTLQIAKNAGYNQNISSPSSKIVRVGIGTNNFASYEWDNVQIYGTGEFELYNNKTYINTFDNDNVIKVSMVGSIFVLTDSDDNVIAKVSGPIIFKTDFGLMGVQGLKRAGQNALYRGQLELVPAAKTGKFHIVNSLMVEEYLRGVVPNEMPVSFGLEALKAQSVAARNYVLSPRVKANPNYDVVDSVASQVYFGANTEKELSNRAVNETFGIVALYGWDLILAQYSSTAGGYTESFENAFSDPVTKKFPSDPKPYLVAKPDDEDFRPLNTEEAAARFYKSKPKSYDVKSSYYRWEREWNGQEIQDAVQANIAAQSAAGFVKPAVKKGETIGIIKELKVLKRGDSGKIIEMEIVTENGNYLVQKELVIRRLFTNKGKALPSANVVFEHEYNDDGDLIYIKAYGGGFGHGVGLSQYGAGFMGKELGKSFDEILKHYYSGITLATEPKILALNVGQDKISDNFYTRDGKAILVVDNKYKMSYVDVVINNVDEKIEFDTSTRYNQIDLSKYLRCGMNTVTFFYPAMLGGNKAIRFYIELAGE